jgi:hypothetical protein
VKEEVVSRPGEGRSSEKKYKLVKEEVARRLGEGWCNSHKDWCLLLSWCLAVGIGVSSRLVSMNICKRLVSLAKLVLSGGDWCLQ